MDVEAKLHHFETKDEEDLDIPTFRTRFDSDSDDYVSDDESTSEANV